MTGANPITTPFNAASTAIEVVKDLDLTGQRVIVTGATSGIGIETARALAGVGAEVTLAVRDVAAGQRTATDIIGTTGNARVLVAPLDLADSTVRRKIYCSLGTLIARANQQCRCHGSTGDADTGRMGAAVCHQPPWAFCLSDRLFPALASARGARIVSVSSSAHLRSPVVFEDIHLRTRPYEPWAAYGQSKTANILFVVDATSRWAYRTGPPRWRSTMSWRATALARRPER